MVVNATHKVAGLAATFLLLGFVLGRLSVPALPVDLGDSLAALQLAPGGGGGGRGHVAPLAVTGGAAAAVSPQDTRQSSAAAGGVGGVGGVGSGSSAAAAPLLGYRNGRCAAGSPSLAAELAWLNFSRAELARFGEINGPALRRLRAALEPLATAGTAGKVAAVLARLAGEVVSGALRLENALERRYVVASMLLALMLYASPAASESARQLLAAVAATHTARARRLAEQAPAATRAPLYLLHVSKAGGTSLCSLSHYNRCQEHPKANNCWIPGAGPVWFATFRHQERTCPQYMDVAKEHGLDIIANEGFLDGGTEGPAEGLCPQMLYITMLRKPIARVVSHMFQAGVKPAGFSREDFKQLSVEKRIEAKPEVSSNYMTRVLLGKQAYYSPLGALNATTHGLQAQRLLSNFDVILLLEQKSRVPVLLEQALGWWNSSDLDRRHGRRSHGGDRSLSPADHKLVEDANQLDVMVYDLATTLFKIDWVMFGCASTMARAAEQGNPLTCANPTRAYPRK